MTKVLFSVSQVVLSSEKHWRKRQRFMNVVYSRSQLESVAKLSFTIISFPLFSRFSARDVFQHTSKQPSKSFRLEAWVSDWTCGSHDSLGSTHLLSVGELFLMSGESCFVFVGNLSLSEWSSHIPPGVKPLVLKRSQASPPSVHIHEPSASKIRLQFAAAIA